MPELSPNTVDYFLKRFSSFDDALLRRFEHRYETAGQQRATIVLSAQDSESDQRWSNVVLVVDGVSEVRLHEGPATCQVLSSGLHIGWFAGSVFVDLSPYSYDPGGVEDYRKSDFYVAGKRCSWEVLPYSEE